jgi:hypothetical protein
LEIFALAFGDLDIGASKSMYRTIAARRRWFDAPLSNVSIRKCSNAQINAQI